MRGGGAGATGEASQGQPRQRQNEERTAISILAPALAGERDIDPVPARREDSQVRRDRDRNHGGRQPGGRPRLSSSACQERWSRPWSQ